MNITVELLTTVRLHESEIPMRYDIASLPMHHCLRMSRKQLHLTTLR